jgi:hypothetical protein
MRSPVWTASSTASARSGKLARAATTSRTYSSRVRNRGGGVGGLLDLDRLEGEVLLERDLIVLLEPVREREDRDVDLLRGRRADLVLLASLTDVPLQVLARQAAEGVDPRARQQREQVEIPLERALPESFAHVS